MFALLKRTAIAATLVSGTAIAAFVALLDGTVNTLLMPENKDALVKVLTCRVVAANSTRKR